MKVLLFGILADDIGMSEIETESVQDTHALQKYLLDRFPSLRNKHFKIAVNKELIVKNAVLNDEDEVALLPPFAGG